MRRDVNRTLVTLRDTSHPFYYGQTLTVKAAKCKGHETTCTLTGHTINMTYGMKYVNTVTIALNVSKF